MKTCLFPQTILFLFLCFIGSAAQAPGSLDPTFGGGDGTVAYSNPLVGAIASDFAIQSDGRLVSLTGPKGGQDSTYSLIRINPDGSLDTSFNGTGTRSFQWGFASKTGGWYFGYAHAIGVQNIGGSERIVVAGQAPKMNGKAVANFMRVDRFLLDGTNDTSFGTNGSVYLSVGQAYDIEIQPDQKIVGITEGPNNKVFRLNANGTLDATFGSGGITSSGTGYLQRLALDSDGSVLVAAQISSGRGSNSVHSNEVRKYKPNGSLDTSFGVNGAAVFGKSNCSFLPKSIQIDSLHNILLGSQAWTPNLDLSIVRFTQNGLVDTSFGTNGLYLGGFSTYSAQEGAAIMQGDGKILLIGNFENSPNHFRDLLVIRLNYNGSIDSVFGTAGQSIFDISASDGVSVRGGLVQFDQFCSCEKLLVASGNDHLTTFARVIIH
jgi:uncharacterized delta-60 repeat protein